MLPALVPELSYNDLDIKEGGTASNTFLSMVNGTFEGDVECRRYLREIYSKQLNLTIVNQQRELLEAFADEFNDSADTYILEGRIVTFLKAFNCS